MPIHTPDLFWFFSLVKATHRSSDDGAFMFKLARLEQHITNFASDHQIDLIKILMNSWLKSHSNSQTYKSILELGAIADIAHFKAPDLN
ncbi:MAG: hypothetical protein HC869_13470 [Rhodospirillales bacterium]|nr:hypothetical protein [Rhodospirillales bacterium]